MNKMSIVLTTGSLCPELHSYHPRFHMALKKKKKTKNRKTDL